MIFARHDPEPGRDSQGRFISDDATARRILFGFVDTFRDLLAFMLSPAMDASTRERVAKAAIERLDSLESWINVIDVGRRESHEGQGSIRTTQAPGKGRLAEEDAVGQRQEDQATP